MLFPVGADTKFNRHCAAILRNHGVTKQQVASGDRRKVRCHPEMIMCESHLPLHLQAARGEGTGPMQRDAA
jgi:hypothetical protein